MNVFTIEEHFPTLVTPNKKISFNELIDEIQINKAVIDQLLLKKGALLFRGFPIDTPEQFSHFIDALKLGKKVNYLLGDSPRDKVKKQVYTSTETPAKFHLPLHQELSYINKFPQHIYFFCQIAPSYRGETLIADARQIYQSLDHEVIQYFKDKGLIYLSRYYCKDKIMKTLNRLVRSHKSWTEVFETQNKSEVESICQNNEVEFQWLGKDWIELKQYRPALVTHPITQETVWFNQAHLFDFNPRLLGLLNYIGAKILYCRPSTKLHEIRFGDNSPIPRSYIYHILDVLEKKTVAYPWQKGDVMVLDNILSMHGRAPFKGKRRILTALTT
ncbi:TauD/TfdA family dioxygenase [Legionella worsleiensis]|uniref:Pyoverdine biosynthesis regulatory protein SyrP-like protein n=1 Tax=Legionella worsleiensis TaxID=45076 RepID=A0A0W1A6L0_9GAMM|nr:TauD/TfdA family dioxygenase [Legionella worsleiensis]KTD76971.1 pyoverdine biosynthesis regulatory protein SyrP-like protein [Legionella worsleiensis]STY33357.1 pyoverdine biosynthesis regulatory protein SyrP-like [Legionella worsleiensis]